MTVKHVPRNVNAVIVGNGPSALILSYIFHGHIPYYNASNPHPDPILHLKLSRSPCLLDINVDDLTAHFGPSRFSYSHQALPVNVLLDTLVRPLADTHPSEYQSCLEWRFKENCQINHVVVGNTGHAGGQWADNPVSTSWDIGALSYAEMLSLPGYSFKEHYTSIHDGKPLPDFHRPTRREVAEYLSTYPKAVGIKDAVYTGITLDGISRTEQGFYVASHDIFCKNLVLASGTFSSLTPARPLLQPLKNMPAASSCADAPLLIIGSGFTAADVIISTPPNRKIIHIYKWDPENHPSPLRACHRSAYPEYAKVYRRMKLAARQALGADVVSPFPGKNGPFSEHDGNYEGLPNTYINDVHIRDQCATLWLETGDKRLIKREVSNMEYVIGRRGSLDYLNKHIREEVLGSIDEGIPISGQTFRPKTEKNVEVAPQIFAIGSLTGDSLVRFAYGGCVLAAKWIIKDALSCQVISYNSCNPSEVGRFMPEVEAELEGTKKIMRANIEKVCERSGYALGMEQRLQSDCVKNCDFFEQAHR